MKKFVAVYFAPHEALDEMMKSATPERQQEMMGAWQAWMEKHKASFVDQGAPLGKSKRVSASGAEDVRNDINGYSVVEADSHEEAAKIFMDNPQLQMPGAYVEVLEWITMPGM